jgi:hypothetical protein
MKTRRGVFIAGGLNHLTEIYGQQKRDVPHSTDTITINEIVGTWQPFSAKISVTKQNAEGYEEGQASKQMKFRS